MRRAKDATKRTTTTLKSTRCDWCAAGRANTGGMAKRAAITATATRNSTRAGEGRGTGAAM